MKKVLVSILTIFFVLSMITNVYAATTGTVTVTSSVDTVKAGDEFYIIVKAKDSIGLNSVVYSGIAITNEKGETTSAITVNSVAALSSFSEMKNDEGNSEFMYSNNAVNTEETEIFKVTFKVAENITSGTYNINIQGLEVYSVEGATTDDTTDVGTKTVSVKALVDEEPSEEPENTTETPSNTNKNTTKNTSKNTVKNTTKLPQTGVESISILAIIALGALGIASYVSYRKYKNI